MISLFNLGILLTRKCNQRCYYCNHVEDSIYTEVDVDYLQYVLSIYHEYGLNNLHIELSGGEPGIISNIEDVINLLMSLSYVQKITIMSNGTIRKLFDVAKVLLHKFQKPNGYQEHCCLEIQDKNILYFDNDITFFNAPLYTESVLVLSEVTLDSLLDNFSYYQSMGLFDCNIHYKCMTPKIEYPSTDIINKTKKFYNMLPSRSMKDTLYLSNIEKDNLSLYRNICSKITKYQFIDLEYKNIGQCCLHVKHAPRFNITKENIHLTLQGKLFSLSSFCQKCYKFDSNCLQYYLQRKQYCYNL